MNTWILILLIVSSDMTHTSGVSVPGFISEDACTKAATKAVAELTAGPKFIRARAVCVATGG
jgi:hypothetical protein